MDLLGSCVKSLQRVPWITPGKSNTGHSGLHARHDVDDPMPSHHSPSSFLPAGPSPMIEPDDLDLVACLPREVALKIFSFLTHNALASAAQTCHFWRTLSEDDILWRGKNRELCLPDDREKFAQSVCDQGYRGSLWKLNYAKQFSLDRNWRYGAKQPQSLRAHRGHLVTCLLFTDDGRVVSGSDDGTLKVWSLADGRCLHTLAGHNGGVWAAEVEGNMLISGATDKTVRIWDISSGAMVDILYGHGGTVRCLALKDGICVSGSRDTTLRIWTVRLGNRDHHSGQGSNGTTCFLLYGHTESVRCVRYNGQYIVSGSYDSQIRVWDPKSHKCLHVLIGHTDRVYSLQFDGVHIVSGSLDSTIRVWDVKTGVQKHALTGHETFISSMYQRDNLLVSGTADSAVRLWDIRTGTCLRSFGNDDMRHETAVTSVHFDRNFVVTSSDDGTCKLWDLHTGDFIRDLITLPTRFLGGVVWRIVANETKLVCAVGSRDEDNVITDVEETKVLVFDFDVDFAIENGRAVWHK